MYPAPSGAISVTFSGATIWNQGTAGDSVIAGISNGGVKISKKPVDPLSSAEYAYSVTSETREYSLMANYEGDTLSFQSAP